MSWREPRHEFDRATALRQREGGATAEIAGEFAAGESAQGGYLAALVLAALRPHAEGRPLLSLYATFLSPPRTGGAEIEAELIRAGRRLSTVSGRLLQDGREKVRVLATFIDAAAGRGPTRLGLAPPTLPPPQDCVELGELRPELAASPVDRRLELRTRPDDPFLLGSDTTFAGWIRLRDGRPLDELALPLLADAFPVPVLGLAPGEWVPTLEMSVHVRRAPSGAWLLGRYGTTTLLDGRFDGDLDLWDAEGRLVATSRQLAMVLAP